MSDETIVTKDGLIGLSEAADYLDTSKQYLSKMLGEPGDIDPHPLTDYFRHYSGRWRTTYALLDEFFTNGKVIGNKQFPSEKGKHVG